MEYVINTYVSYKNGEVIGQELVEKLQYKNREDFFEDLPGIMEKEKDERGIDFNSKCNYLLLKITENNNEYGSSQKTIFNIKEKGGVIKISEDGQTPFLPVDEYMENYVTEE